ncbi:MAG: hypothetical protein WEF50_06030 [Myxococcota bacterium]
MSEASARPAAPLWQKALPWLITLVCFGFLWSRVQGAAARADLDVASYMARVLASVRWGPWLALMIPYSLLFLLIDTVVIWRVIRWFNAPVRVRDVLPIRASSYILSIVNEQVGKGAIAVYLNRRNGIPGFEVGSSMLFIMFCEFYYLLAWATFGYLLSGSTLPPIFGVIPIVAVAALAFFALWCAFFGGRLGSGSALRDRAILRAFRLARPWQYLGVMLLRSPAMIAAIVVYTIAAGLFGISVDLPTMAGILPVIFFGAAVPGPMRTVAITLWVVLFPGYEGEVTTFAFLQHNFFVFFNASIGLLFLRRAYRELFEGPAPSADPAR